MMATDTRGWRLRTALASVVLGTLLRGVFLWSWQLMQQVPLLLHELRAVHTMLEDRLVLLHHDLLTLRGASNILALRVFDAPALPRPCLPLPDPPRAMPLPEPPPLHHPPAHDVAPEEPQP